MDILHVSLKEIDDMSLVDYSRALDYAHVTVVQRRIDFNLARIFGKKRKSKKKGLTYDLDFTRWNPVYQALQNEKRVPKKVPKRVMEAFKKQYE